MLRNEIILDINYISAGGKRGWGDAGACGVLSSCYDCVDGLTYVGGQETDMARIPNLKVAGVSV